MIPYGKQLIDDEDLNAVMEALKSPLITQGPIVTQFENALLQYTHAKYAVAVNSGTAALHIACLALGIGAGDLVWVSSVSFVASANCALYCGAEVDFVDIDYRTGNISVYDLEIKLKKAPKLPKAIIAVDLAGLPADWEELSQLAHKYNIKLIQDSCHALGARYKDSIIGDCKYSDITVFSFHPVKAITTAEGGMALTNDPELARRLRLFGCHGITRDQERMINEPDGDWYYEQQELGYNYRMPEINAALGLSQLKHLDEWIKIRNDYAKYYYSNLAQLPMQLPPDLEDRYCAYHIYVVKIAHEDRHYFFDEMRKRGIGVNVHYIPIYHQPYYQKLKEYPTLGTTEYFYNEIVTLPITPAISYEDLDYICKSVREILIGG